MEAQCLQMWAGVSREQTHVEKIDDCANVYL